MTGTTCMNCRTDLSDVTFLIPLRVDSIERKENTDVLINYIFKHFITFIIVLESDLTRKYFSENKYKQFQYEFRKIAMNSSIKLNVSLA